MTTLRNRLTGNVFKTRYPVKAYLGSSNRTSDGKPIFEIVKKRKAKPRITRVKKNPRSNHPLIGSMVKINAPGIRGHGHTGKVLSARDGHLQIQSEPSEYTNYMIPETKVKIVRLKKNPRPSEEEKLFNWQNPSRSNVLEMSELWHISRTALAGEKDSSSYARKLWIAKQISQKYGISVNAAYKAQDRAQIGEPFLRNPPKKNPRSKIVRLKKNPVSHRAITNDDLWAAVRGNRMVSKSVDELISMYNEFKDKDAFAAKVIAEAAKQVALTKGAKFVKPKK